MSSINWINPGDLNRVKAQQSRVWEKEIIHQDLALDANVYAMEEQLLMITVVIALPHIEEMGELSLISKLLSNELVEMKS